MIALQEILVAGPDRARTANSGLTAVKSEQPKHAQLTEKSILERVAAGDAAAVNECLDRYGGLVWSLARRYLANQADAEDAVQEIFIEIWSSADRYDPKIAKETTFISTITRRRLIDRVRQKGRRPEAEPLDEQVGANQPAIPSDLEGSAEVVKVERVLADMQPQQREILAMSLYQGYSHSEIAAELDIPLGTVKTKVRRGLIHIREQLEVASEADE